LVAAKRSQLVARVALAPRKSAAASQSGLDNIAIANLWEAFHGGRYAEIPVVLEALTAASLQNPRDTETAAHVAFKHVWALDEGAAFAEAQGPIRPRPAIARR
jgi:hypothetical protein